MRHGVNFAAGTHRDRTTTLAPVPPGPGTGPNLESDEPIAPREAGTPRASFLSHPKETYIALLASSAIALHLGLRFLTAVPPLARELPLYILLVVGGFPLLAGLFAKLLAGRFGSDLLAGISIVSAVLLGQYLVASIVVLMLSGGTALEQYATRRASAVLDALARRMPQIAHRKTASGLRDVKSSEVAIGDTLVVFPHEVCPVDGAVLEGHGVMDESYLTGEPFQISKAPGSQVLSGAINGDTALTIGAEKLAVDSRYAKIMQVMKASEENRPRLRRLADHLGAWYTPLALALAIFAWLATGDRHRFLAVVVVATPCPLLIAIPVAVIGAISLSARRAIIIKNPVVLEQVDACRTLIFDKTGTLTYGRPVLTEVVCGPAFREVDVLRAVASLERYSKHPLARAILAAAQVAGLGLEPATEISEKPGEGLRGIVAGRKVQVTSRGKATSQRLALSRSLPPIAAGMESVVFIDGIYAATLRFHDEPRHETKGFVRHLGPRHRVKKVVLLSGDQDLEVRNLAAMVGISEVHSGVSPEEKVAIVREETRRAKTLFVGDGINDAPALVAATVGVAFGHSNDITPEAAGAVVLETSLSKVDELIHIGRRMRSIALQSAVGGMALSLVGMIFAAGGHLPALAGAIAQELIDLGVVLNALRVALPTRELTDF